MNFLLTDTSSAVAIGLYRSLARLSGGQAIEITEQQLPQALSIVTNSLSPALVDMLDYVMEFHGIAQYMDNI